MATSTMEYKNGIYVVNDNNGHFMDHSLTFGDGTIKNGQFVGTNTWTDWHLIPTTRPKVAEAGVATNFVTVPGRHGTIDMTEYLTGGPVYGDRSGTWEFYVDNDHEWWETIRYKIAKFLHGKRMRVVLNDDALWYYEGRFTLREWNSEQWYSNVHIDYVVGPYKWYVLPSGQWLWDPFNFDTDRTDVWEEKRL